MEFFACTNDHLWCTLYYRETDNSLNNKEWSHQLIHYVEYSYAAQVRVS